MQISASPDNSCDLIAELRNWNGGNGIDPLSWVGHVGNVELAIGYSFLFWPDFVAVDRYVLRPWVTQENLSSWERRTDGSRRDIERVLNHMHIADIHGSPTAQNELQLRYLGRVLALIHKIKLKAEYPDRNFEVWFRDEPNLEPIEYELSFWQID